MPDRPDPGNDAGSVTDRIRGAEPGLAALVAEAEQTWRSRSELPGWRAFEDAFPTFYQFTNRPR
jgi:hypothetical protein